jgi:hypothetical protein
LIRLFDLLLDRGELAGESHPVVHLDSITRIMPYIVLIVSSLFLHLYSTYFKIRREILIPIFTHWLSLSTLLLQILSVVLKAF